MSDKTPKQESKTQSSKVPSGSSNGKSPNASPQKAASAVEDRRKQHGGIAEGGRRKIDRSVVPPMNTSSRIWFGLSLILTIVIMIWTFSVPFRTEKPLFAWDKSDLPERPVMIAPEILNDPEHKMSDRDYQSYIWEIERDLMEQVAIRNRVPDNLPDAAHATAVGERRMQKAEAELESLQELEKNSKKSFEKGSIQQLAMERMRKKLAEAEEYLPAK